MKKISLIFSLVIIAIVIGCGGNNSSEESNNESMVKEQEVEIAEGAQKAVKTAKEQAIETEKEVDKLLEDI